MEDYGDYDVMDGEDEYDMPSRSFQIKGRTYLTTSLFAEAVKAVMKGKLNVNKAASVYGVPRTSLQRKVAQSREEHKRKANKSYVEKLELEAKAKKEKDIKGDEKRLWSEEYQKRLEQISANVIVEDAGEGPSDLLGIGIDDHSLDINNVVSECIIEEDGDYYSNSKGEERSERKEEEDGDIPPPPEIGMENGGLEEYEEEEVVVDEVEDIDGIICEMPRLSSIYEL